MVAKVAQPSNIVRQEQAVMHAIMALDYSAPTQNILERSNLVSFNVEWQIIKTPDGTEAFVGRVVLPLDNISQLPAASKPWLQAQDLPQGANISAYFGSN
ncbi:MAG: hypothetical protein KME45_23245 [Stenomitos rutilans HA7619-LM2]|nr:hypothetical protein [Stenomitos rutilans HA7619-LM2]